MTIPEISYNEWRRRWPADISTRTMNVMWFAKIQHPAQLLETPPAEISRLPGARRVTMRELYAIAEGEAELQLTHWRAWFEIAPEPATKKEEKDG